MTISDVAKICHEANRALCETHDDYSQPPWAEAPDWQTDSAQQGVRFHLDHAEAQPWEAHENWRRLKHEEGWAYGAVKDPEKKEHPCMKPFYELPQAQQVKDSLFAAIVDGLRSFINT